MRWIPSRNEEVFWSLVSRTQQGWASRFGELRGIEDVSPRRRIELAPYAVSSSRIIGDRDRENPFLSAANASGGLGLDAKIGIGPNLSLDVTVNPDFGQVEADPAEVNLSAFETFVREQRPFFTEGNSLLSGGSGNTIYYSRRIGARPPGTASGDYVDHPPASTILGAAKLIGRLPSGLSIGMLAAVTNHHTARTFTRPAQVVRVPVAPRTTYGVTRLRQEFGAPGSAVGVLATVVHRDLQTSDPLAERLARNAVTFNTDTTIRFRDGEYQLSGDAAVSYVSGSPGAIARLQRSSARYFDRPDTTYVAYDPLHTSLLGGRANLGFERREGRHWLWEVEAGMITPSFETNDLGRLTQADRLTASAQIQFRETTPARFYRNYSISLRNNNEWNHGGDRQGGSLQLNANVQWRNFWQTTINNSFNFRVRDLRLTRGGPSMEEPRSWRTNLRMQSPNAARTRGNISASYRRGEDGGLEFGLEGQLTFQPGSRWQLSVNPSYNRNVLSQQYVTTLPGGPLLTYGNRYVFANIDRSTYSKELRVNYALKPDVTLELYAEPFAASGRYSSFGELAAPRTRLRRLYGTEGTSLVALPDGGYLVREGDTSFRLDNRDFNVQSFRSNLVLRWEWRAGSTFYVVWQQNRAAEEAIGARATPRDMLGAIGARADHFFAIKTSFWLSPN